MNDNSGFTVAHQTVIKLEKMLHDEVHDSDDAAAKHKYLMARNHMAGGNYRAAQKEAQMAIDILEGR